MTTTTKRRPSVAVLNKRFQVAYARHLHLLTNGDWPATGDVEAWNVWHAERAEVHEELSAVYAGLRDREQGIGGVVWHGYQTAFQHWEASAERHRAYIKPAGGVR
jgi:hypothetical protein